MAEDAIFEEGLELSLFIQVSCVGMGKYVGQKHTSSMPIKSSGRIVPPGWAPLQPKQSVLSLIV